MPLPTLADADAQVVDLMPESSTGGLFASTSQRYRAIAALCNRIAWVTAVNSAEADVAITDGTDTYDLGAGGTGPADDAFHPSRVLDLRIGNYDALRFARTEDEIREDLRHGGRGRPDTYWFPLPHELMVAPVPDGAYTAKLRWIPPIVIDPAESTPDNVDLPIPADWLYEGLELGAWHYLTRTRSKFDHGEPANQAFEFFLARIGQRHQRPTISGSRGPDDPLL